MAESEPDRDIESDIEMEEDTTSPSQQAEPLDTIMSLASTPSSGDIPTLAQQTNDMELDDSSVISLDNEAGQIIDTRDINMATMDDPSSFQMPIQLPGMSDSEFALVLQEWHTMIEEVNLIM